MSVKFLISAVVTLLDELGGGIGTDLSSSREVQFLICVYWVSVKKEARKPLMMASA